MCLRLLICVLCHYCVYIVAIYILICHHYDYDYHYVVIVLLVCREMHMDGSHALHAEQTTSSRTVACTLPLLMVVVVVYMQRILRRGMLHPNKEP